MSDEEKDVKEPKKAKKATKKKEEPKPEPQVKEETEEKTVIKLTKNFRSYSIKGHVFTRKEPYKVLPVDVAEDLIATQPDHFQLATRKEVADFYGE